MLLHKLIILMLGILCASVSACNGTDFAGNEASKGEKQIAAPSLPSANIPTSVTQPIAPVTASIGPEPVDPMCSSDAIAPTSVINPPIMQLPKTVPENCRIGFEMNNLYNNSYTISGKGNAKEFLLEVDVATYTAPDIIRISGSSPSGNYTLLDTCRIRTAAYPDPTGGGRRPPEDSIRQFRPRIRAGTTSLTFNFSRSSTPTYIRVIGLCDFSVIQGPRNIRPVTN